MFTNHRGGGVLSALVKTLFIIYKIYLLVDLYTCIDIDIDIDLYILYLYIIYQNI